MERSVERALSRVAVLVLLFHTVLGAGCGSPTRPMPSAPRLQAFAPRSMMSAPRPDEWQERTLVGHPLVGRIYRPTSGEFTALADVEEALRSARFLLLGEKHDNRDHHRLEATLLGEFVRGRHSVAVAFEMLDVDQQLVVDQYLSAHPSEVDGLGRAVDWDASGWPPWPFYRPVFAVALKWHARIVAANLSRERARAIVQRGEAAFGTELPPLSPAALGDMENEMRESHCGLLPESMLPGMVLAQRARDFTMAQRMLEADRGDGVALCAGAGHVRQDTGVPVSLRAAGATGVLSIAFVEVVRGQPDPRSYLPAPFDFLWFTPRVDEKDPCAELRHGRR
jgi:uncharacterized iron-regulated protein